MTTENVTVGPPVGCPDFIYPAGREDVWFCDHCDVNIALHPQKDWKALNEQVYAAQLRARGARELKRGLEGERRVY